MVAIIVVVHFVESHVLQPFLMGHAVAVHPLAVIVIVAAGTYLFGVAGALFAVPVAAALNASIRYLLGRDMFPQLDAGETSAADTASLVSAAPDKAPTESPTRDE